MPRAAGSPTSSFDLPREVTLGDLRPQPVPGHLLRTARASNERWRDASGRQHEKVLGKAWTRRGRPAEGYLTQQGAQQLLDEIVVQARQAGPDKARRSHDLTFANAAAECCATSSTTAAGAPDTARLPPHGRSGARAAVR